MSPDEALHLCRLAKAMCPALAVDEFTPEAWGLALAPERFEDAKDALIRVVRRESWVDISKIVGEVKFIRGERLRAYGPITPPPEVESGEREYHEWFVTTHKAIADGELKPPPLRPVDKEGQERLARELEGTLREVPRR